MQARAAAGELLLRAGGTATERQQRQAAEQGRQDARDHARKSDSGVPMMALDADLVQRLAEAATEFDATASDLERNCWMAVHRHVHGVLPSEYDIREVPEELYLAVLERRRAQTSG